MYGCNKRTNYVNRSILFFVFARAAFSVADFPPYKPSTLPRIPLRFRAIQHRRCRWTILLESRKSRSLRISWKDERARPDTVARRKQGNEKDGIATAGISIEASLAVRRSRQTGSVEYRSLRKASKETKRESTRKGRQMGRSSCTVRT